MTIRVLEMFLGNLSINVNLELLDQNLNNRLLGKLYYGDNLEILRERIDDASVDLIYLDPPFNSNVNYNVIFKTERSGGGGSRRFSISIISF